jgi:glycosyltransferase involved in cell wall biosynthesis
MPKVFMMDLWAAVPYYTAYLAKALRGEPVALTVGSISYYLDPNCFSSRDIKVDPGWIDVVGRWQLPRTLRRVLKLLEGTINLCVLTVRFIISPPDLIHVQYLSMLRTWLPLDLWFVELCRWRGVKIVLTVHDLLPHDTGERFHAKFDALYRSVDEIICHSDAVRAMLAAEFLVASEKISVIPHGPFFYDLPAGDDAEFMRSFSLDPQEKIILWQGIIFPYKGLDLLLRAWQLVEAKQNDASLVIAGTGSPELLQEIRAQVDTLRLEQVKLHLRFISSEELVALYRAADVVVYPYRAITTSGALATGLALGKAIVASDLAVFRELLTDRESALLVAPEECEALAAALIELIEDTALRERLEGNVHAMNFGDESWRAIARKTVAVYERVLSRAN